MSVQDLKITKRTFGYKGEHFFVYHGFGGRTLIFHRTADKTGLVLYWRRYNIVAVTFLDVALRFRVDKPGFGRMLEGFQFVRDVMAADNSPFAVPQG